MRITAEALACPAKRSTHHLKFAATSGPQYPMAREVENARLQFVEALRYTSQAL
jgi:hypothetical protein